ncbi:MAG TPA: caspase family protein [Flavisolibacter sp.]|nr:caspase family protein [Flavisolibacter sp.]
MKKKLISIGINNAKGMTGLQAAASGAEQFAKWASSQGYEIDVFTDNNGKAVRTYQIFDAVNSCIQSKTYEQLIIFFSGHGVLKGPNQEVWILSEAINNPNESINLTGSIDNARTCGIPYIVFISDACRVLPTEIQLTGSGSVIFPICDDNNVDCAVDIYYATRPGSPANEIAEKESSKKFGIFTECLIEGLSGKRLEVLEAETDGSLFAQFLKKTIPLLSPTPAFLIRSARLRNLLRNTVPEKAQSKSIFLNQYPEIRIEVAEKNYLAKYEFQFIENSTSSDYPMETAESIDTPFVEKFHEVTSSRAWQPNKPIKLPFPTENGAIIYAAQGRESFETRTGFTIVGGEIKDVIVYKSKREIFSEKGMQQVRIHDDDNIYSAIIVLRNGESVPVAVIKGYIGTMVFNDQVLLTVNYTPSRNTNKYGEYESKKDKVNFARGYVASAAAEGLDYRKVFEKEFTSDGNINYNDIGGFLRMEKSLDPSLGLYAAYAYRQAGKQKEIQSVQEYMAREGHNIFDVIMLADRLLEYKEKVMPFCPMLSLGWAYSNRFEKLLHPEVRRAALHLAPNLWTTFDEKGTEILEHLVNQNVLR